MPTAARKPCTVCGMLVDGGGSRCEPHRWVAKFADQRRGSRQARGYGAEWDRTRERILLRDAGLCQPCHEADRVTAATEVDHITPRAEGGTDDDGNLQAICTTCHRAKTVREAARGRGRRGRVV